MSQTGSSVRSLQAVPSRADLIARAEALERVLLERATRAEEARQMLPETLADFRAAGFYRIIQPRRYCGYELDFDTLFQVVVAIGSACPSSAWCLSLLTIHNWFVAWWPEAGQDIMFADEEHPLIAIALAPQGTAEKVDGGYRVNGKWGYASGVEESNFVGVAGRVTGLPEGEESPPVTVIIPKEQIEVFDDWYTLGLRGTGSKSIVCKDVFVPEHMSCVLAHCEHGAPGKDAHDNPIYQGFARTPVFAMGGTAPALGAARLMIDGYRNRLDTHKSAFLRSDHSKLIPSQIRLGRANSLYESAHGLFFSAINEYMDLVNTRAEITLEHRTRYRSQSSQVLDFCVQIVDLIMADAGTGAYFDGSPMQRAFRDVHMLQSHVAMSMDNAAENYGKVLLGLDPVPPLI